MLLNFFVIIITKSITQSKILENVGQNVKKSKLMHALKRTREHEFWNFNITIDPILAFII